jgi:hypothetical protein
MARSEHIATAIDPALAKVTDQLAAVNEDVRRLRLPQRTFLLVYGAQGIIDNGGLRYFFENDFPHQPPYSLFVNAYRRIWSRKEAAALSRAVGYFPFRQPHRSMELRREFMASLPQSHDFFRLDRQVCGNEAVWSRLAAYVVEHGAAFGTRPNKRS